MTANRNLRTMAKSGLKRKGIRRREAYLRALEKQYGHREAFLLAFFDNVKLPQVSWEEFAGTATPEGGPSQEGS